jgi:hypothetical protein
MSAMGLVPVVILFGVSAVAALFSFRWAGRFTLARPEQVQRNGCHLAFYAANSSSSALASFRSRVSKPSVNQPYTGASSSRACCDLP